MPDDERDSRRGGCPVGVRRDELAVVLDAPAADGDVEVVREWCVDRSCEGAVFVADDCRRGEGGETGDEVVRSVERVDDPGVLALPTEVTGLLGVDVVV